MTNPTIKNQVMDYLQWSSEEYEARIFLAIWNWSELHGKYPSIIQQLIANANINNVFIYEYQKLEKQFLQIVEVLPKDCKKLENHYKACTSEIMSFNPKNLIKSICRNRDFSNQFVTNTPIYYAN